MSAGYARHTEQKMIYGNPILFATPTCRREVKAILQVAGRGHHTEFAEVSEFEVVGDVSDELVGKSVSLDIETCADDR